jgi:hypothetical protein
MADGFVKRSMGMANGIRRPCCGLHDAVCLGIGASFFDHFTKPFFDDFLRIQNFPLN